MRALVLAVLALSAVCGAEPLKTVTLADCAINGFTVGDSVETMRGALGEPSRQVFAKVPSNDFKHLEVHYDGILITFSQHEHSAMSYVVDSPDYPLQSGVGVGSTLAELLEALGPSDILFSGGHQTWSYKVLNGDGQPVLATLRFSIEGETVARFSVDSRK